MRTINGSVTSTPYTTPIVEINDRSFVKATISIETNAARVNGHLVNPGSFAYLSMDEYRHLTIESADGSSQVDFVITLEV